MSTQRPLSRHLVSPTDEARISRMWAGIRKAQPLRERRRRFVTIAVLPLAAVSIAGLVGWLSSKPEVAPIETPPAEPAWIVPPRFEAPTARRFPLPDGSSIQLAAGSRLTTIHSDADRFVTLLERGRATFEVEPGGPRRWIVESGLATVEVVGTVFEVDRRRDTVHILVTRGVVVVRGERVPDRVVRLTAGEALTVRGPPDTAGAQNEAPAEAGAPDEPSSGRALPRGAAPQTLPPRAHRASPEIRLPAGRPEPPPVAPSLGEVERHDLAALVRSANAARRAGDIARAARLLERASAHDGPRAALAAFTLGRLEMDTLHRRRRARRALRRALTIGLPERLEQQAERRLRALE